MNYNFVNVNQIANMDYVNLVQMLSLQINPETRAVILQRLTDLNNNLMTGNNDFVNDYTRNGILNTRKADLSENMHPSNNIVHLKDDYKQLNPLPLHNPMSSSMSRLNNYTPTNYVNNNDYVSQINGNYSGKVARDYDSNIDIDDIIDDLKDNLKNESLDDKLMKIKNLHAKIINDKKMRKKITQQLCKH